MRVVVGSGLGAKVVAKRKWVQGRGGVLSAEAEEEEEEGHNKDIIIWASTFSYPTFRF